MEAQDSKFAVKVLPSLTDFAFLLPIAFLFGRMDGLQSLLGDCDTGWHIRTGEWILAHGRVPMHDIFSYSKPDGVWYAWEWLSDVLFAGLNAVGGLAAVALLAIVLLAAIFTLVFLEARRKSNAVVAFVVTAGAAAASSIHWLARPHLFTLLFVVAFYMVLERVREGRTWLLALLPPATILWTNLHGGFFVGVAMILAFGLGELLTAAFAADRGGWRLRWHNAARYGITGLASLAASLANPYTYHLHQHVLAYVRDPYQSTHIMEFLSVSFHHPMAIFFEAMLLGGVLALVWYVSEGRFTEPLLLVMWAHAALLAARNIPIFTILAAPLVAEAALAAVKTIPRREVAGWLRAVAARFDRVAGEMSATDGLARWHVVSVAGVLLVAALLYAPHPPKRFRAEFDPQAYPAGAVETLRRDSSARIFTYDQWGDYLIYRLYPSTKVFVDGRSDFYGDDFEKKTIEVLNVNYGWDQTLSKFAVDTVLLPPSTPLTGALKESSRWRVVYDDGIALVFRRQQQRGETISGTSTGLSRDREVTKTQAAGRPIIRDKSKT